MSFVRVRVRVRVRGAPGSWSNVGDVHAFDVVVVHGPHARRRTAV